MNMFYIPLIPTMGSASKETTQRNRTVLKEVEGEDFPLKEVVLEELPMEKVIKHIAKGNQKWYV